MPLILKLKENGQKMVPFYLKQPLIYQSITPKNHVATLSWTALTEKDTTISAAINLMLSQNVKKGLEALEDFSRSILKFFVG